MAIDLLSRYGIKEVADVTFYELDDNGNRTHPVLFLDTLKVSNVEQTAESTSARGGKGNAELITWDFGKEITVTLEDALYSMKSLAVQYGTEGYNPDTKTVLRTVLAANVKETEKDGTKTYSFEENDKTLTFSKTPTFYKVDGESATSLTEAVYVTGEISVTDKIVVDISANTFPGNYYVTGDTYARNENSGKDDFFQLIFPKVKVLSESNTLTLEAEGDPTVFSMSLKVLRPKTGAMMQLVQYTLGNS